MPSVGWVVFILSSKFSSSTVFFFFFETLVDNIKNWSYKVRQLLQNETENSYQEFITKCDRGLFQSALGITKCVRYYKVWQTVITKCVRYYKCDRLLLQSAIGITKCDVSGITKQNVTSLKSVLKFWWF